MDKFTGQKKTEKYVIYSDDEDQYRTNAQVLSWRNLNSVFQDIN